MIALPSRFREWRPAAGPVWDLRHTTIVFGAVVMTLLWGGILLTLANEKARVLFNAEHDTANFSRAFEEHIVRTLKGIDQSLLHLKAEYEKAPARFDPVAATANNTVLMGLSVQVGVIDTAGFQQSGTAPLPQGQRVYLGDREHFRVHADRTVEGLFISKPVRGRASGKWSIQLTRRLEGPEGAFLGVLVISLSPYYLVDFYDSIDLGPQGLIALIGLDGVVRARAGQEKEVIDQSLAEDPSFARLLLTRAGSLVAPGLLDGIPRIESYRTLEDFPLIVLVGRTESQVLQENQATTMASVATGIGVSIVLIGLTIVLLVQIRKQQGVEQALRRNEAALITHREQLQRSHAELRRLTEITTHDLQEPLRTVASYAQLLRRRYQGKLDETADIYIGHLVEGAVRMKAQLVDLLRYAAVDQDVPPDQLVDSAAACHDALKPLNRAIADSGADVQCGPLPIVLAHADQLGLVFRHLVANAIEYRAEGRTPEIRIAARRDDRHWLFSVSDNGIGIEPQYLDRIFEIFERLHTRHRHHGTGMGLAICKRIVEHHGGRIWAESTPGVGSAFLFTLPVME